MVYVMEKRKMATKGRGKFNAVLTSPERQLSLIIRDFTGNACQPGTIWSLAPPQA